MQWTKEVPTEPGWYWVRARDPIHNGWCKCIVMLLDPDGRWHFGRDPEGVMTAKGDAHFAGPIEVPRWNAMNSSDKCESWCEHDAITHERIEGGIREVCGNCGMSWNLTNDGRLWTEEPKGALSDG